MYIFKYAYLSVIRNKGRNILIGIIIMAITISACIALTINKSGNNLVNTYIDSNPLSVSFTMDPSVYRNATDDEKESITPITIEDVIKYGTSDYISDYYYTLTSSLESDDIEKVSYDEMYKTPDERTTGTSSTDTTQHFNQMFNRNSGFSFVAYSNPAYNTNFVDGTNKITSGEMFNSDSVNKEAVISSELASTNSINVGDKITFYSTSDSTIKYEFIVIGIYEDSTEVESTPGMQGNSRNTIYIPIEVAKTILSKEEASVTTMGLSSKYYLKNNNDLSSFETEVRSKGLSSVYTVRTNEDEITQTLEPIKSISKFSQSFLIVVLIIGAIILSIINILNIRERKYEIGVSRAIGMTKSKITLQLVAEMLIVSIASLIIGTSIGILSSQPITNTILKNEISNYQNSANEISNNFGGKEFSKGNMQGPGNRRMANINYVDSLKVTISPLIIIELFIISLTLTIVSGMIAITFINKYEPNKILQNRT